MLLESETESEHAETETTTTRFDTTNKSIDVDEFFIDMVKHVVRQRDAPRGTASTAPIALNNAFTIWQTSCEDSDDDEETFDFGARVDRIVGAQKKKMAVRRRRSASKGQQTIVYDISGLHKRDCTIGEHNQYCCREDLYNHEVDTKIAGDVGHRARRMNVHFATPLACSTQATCSNQRDHMHHDNTQLSYADEEAIRDAAAAGCEFDEDWLVFGSTPQTQPQQQL